MIYQPQNYRIEDKAMEPFIDVEEIHEILNQAEPTPENVREVIAKALDKNRLSMQEVALLVKTTDPQLIDEIKQGARTLKERVYGHRIVLFAPLYIGSHCVNVCTYCGFKATNKQIKRATLNREEIIQQVTALEDQGQKRLILVYGEHPRYDAHFIAESVRVVYGVKSGNGEIRRVNINAAPFSVEDFRIIGEAGIGTFQVFQETYHQETYQKVHIKGQKSDYNWRLTALDRAQEAGIDDVGIGALFGLYDWRFDILGLIRHVNHFEAVYKVGPHTISFPRIQHASDLEVDPQYLVSDEDFTKLVAILRLAVPYTGLILTAREPKEIRNEILRFGVSQIDGGTNIELGGYSDKDQTHEHPEKQDIENEQFQINDNRSLNEVIEELVTNDYIPSFCTACYRLGRTGEHFMEFSVPGFIKRFCDPNGVLTLAEYLEDYAPVTTKEKGYKLIHSKIDELSQTQNVAPILEKLEKIQKGERDLYF
jgi:2-iminoacetate synthase